MRAQAKLCIACAVFFTVVIAVLLVHSACIASIVMLALAYKVIRTAWQL